MGIQSAPQPSRGSRTIRSTGEGELRSWRIAIDPRAESVEVRTGSLRADFRLCADPTPERFGWLHLGAGEVEPDRGVPARAVFDFCLRDPRAVAVVEAMTRGFTARARAEAERLSGPRRERMNGLVSSLGCELGKARQAGRTSILPLRLLFLERLAAGRLTLTEVADRIGWMVHRPGIEPSPDTSRVLRRLGLEPSVCVKGRRRESYSTSAGAEGFAALCRGLEVDPHEVDPGYQVEVSVAGGEPEPPCRPAAAVRGLRPRSAVLARYTHPARGGHVIRLAGRLVVDEGRGGWRLLLAVLEPEEGREQAQAVAREYVAVAGEAEEPLCRALTPEEERLLPGCDASERPEVAA